MAQPCVFCQIISGKLPATLVYSDSICFCFMDIHPVNPGHMLVVPIAHALLFDELSPEVGKHIFQVGARLSTALRNAPVRCEGVNLEFTDGESGFREVAHVHLHVFPRFEGDGYTNLQNRHINEETPRSVLKSIASGIAAALEPKPEPKKKPKSKTR